MKDVLIIAHFCSDFDDKGNNRFNYLAKLFAENGYKVELITSDFSHFKKEKREQISFNFPYKVTFIEEKGYKKNISFKRFYSHYLMGKMLEKYLSKRISPDIIYCAVPSLDVATVTAKYALKKDIRLIIDVQDLWPEAFKMIFHIPILSSLIYFPMKKVADYVYSSADEIIAVSKTFSDRALSVNKKCKKAYSIFLGTELDNFDKIAKVNRIREKPTSEVWLVYIGTLGHSYDLKCVIDAVSILTKKGVSNIKFIIMGDGPLKRKLEKYACESGINVEFTGGLDYGEMAGVLKQCDIAVNPISKGSISSIINKVCDYSAAGLPVLNTQECQEYRELVEEYEIGLNCINADAENLANNLEILNNDIDLRKKMGRNSRRLAEEKFDRKFTYKTILELLE